MKRTLIALAVGSAFAAPAVYADVTISGAINMGLEYVNVGKTSDAAAAAGAPDNDGAGTIGVATNYSNVTISSMEDLGGGLKLDFAFQVVAPTASTSGSAGVVNRNSHIGLVGESWGGFWYGSNENIYERYFYSVDPLDGAAGLGGNLQIMGTPGGRVFTTCDANSDSFTAGGCGYTWYRRDAPVIWYDSPNFNGFTFGVVYQMPGAGKTPSISPQMFQIGGKYVGTTMPLQVWGAYGQRKDEFGLVSFAGTVPGGILSTAGATDSSDDAWQLGAGYTLGDVFFFGVYEDIKYKLSGVTAGGVEEWSRWAYQLGLKWNLASGYVGASWMQAGDADCTAVGATCDANDTGAYALGVGYYHTMSKQTQVYGVIGYLDNADLANYGTAGIGSSASFQNLGATYWGVGLGIKHTF